MQYILKLLELREFISCIRYYIIIKVFVVSHFMAFTLQVDGTAIGFMSISDDVNADLLNKCFELGALHGLRKPHPEDQVTPTQTPPPEPPTGKITYHQNLK